MDDDEVKKPETPDVEVPARAEPHDRPSAKAGMGLKDWTAIAAVPLDPSDDLLVMKIEDSPDTGLARSAQAAIFEANVFLNAVGRSEKYER